jgi:Na+-transporting NADH:ubiquinone oxidoreductase subunit C
MVDSALQEAPIKALSVSLAVAFVCALAVSVTAVSLRPHYLANLEAQRMGRLEAILVLLRDSAGEVTATDIESNVVELASGQLAENIDPAIYDARKAARDPAKSTTIPPDLDLAGIKRRENYAVVYLVKDGAGKVNVAILPIWGVGYQSALYGYLAVDPHSNEILAIKFYEHGETPGLGSRIQDPDWEALWPGKRAYDDSGAVSIHVGDRSGGDSASRVDAVSGATRTSMGVNGMVRFWLGEFGFKSFLDRVRQQG